MKNDETKAVRGDEGWKAAKAAVAKRNEVAYERGRKERAAREAAVHRQRADAERREYAHLPSTKPTSSG